MFAPGDLVVCVRRPDYAAFAAAPEVGTVYTIRDVIEAWAGSHPGETFVHLREITNPVDDYPEGRGEPWFWHAYFRPVDDSNIEIFRSILRDVPIEAEPVA